MELEFRYDEPQYREEPGITNDIPEPSNMYGKELRNMTKKRTPRYNEHTLPVLLALHYIAFHCTLNGSYLPQVGFL